MNRLDVLIDEAERKGLWLYCLYQALWFSPKDLKRLNEMGKFCWGPENFALRDPAVGERQIEKRIEEAQAALEKFRRDRDNGTAGWFP